MKLDTAITRLSVNAEAIAALARNVSGAQAHWRPAPEEWSILEVICHLYDEEREDFRTRVRLTLESKDADWPPINPVAWVTERGYNQRELRPSLDAFLQERQRSVQWLAGLVNPDWNSTHYHPQFAPMTAGDVLAAWVAHDHLHIRQLNQLHWQYLSRDALPISLDYAGGW